MAAGPHSAERPGAPARKGLVVLQCLDLKRNPKSVCGKAGRAVPQQAAPGQLTRVSAGAATLGGVRCGEEGCLGMLLTGQQVPSPKRSFLFVSSYINISSA